MLLLSETLPLRGSDELGDYEDSAPLAHCYGDLSASPVPLTAISRTEFHVSEGKVTPLAVFVDEQEIKSWEAFFGDGYTGIRIASPLPPGSAISATLTGKRSADTGELIENPADIIANVFRIARRAPPVALQEFRATVAGLKLAGVINTRQSIRAAIDEIIRSAGAIWTASTSAFALYPTPAPGGTRYTLDARNSSLPALSRDAADSAGALTLTYAQNWAKARPARSITATARSGQYRNTVALSIAAPWLRQTRDADAIVSRVLARLAGDALQVTLAAEIPGAEWGGLEAIRPGRWVNLAHAHASGPMIILGWQWAPGARSVQITGELAATIAPVIEITGRSAARVTADDGGVEVAYKNGIATFTILDPDGKPLPGAQVSLDGSYAKIADERGQVRFETAQGKHKLAVAAKGYMPFEIEVEV